MMKKLLFLLVALLSVGFVSAQDCPITGIPAAIYGGADGSYACDGSVIYKCESGSWVHQSTYCPSSARNCEPTGSADGGYTGTGYECVDWCEFSEGGTPVNDGDWECWAGSQIWHCENGEWDLNDIVYCSSPTPHCINDQCVECTYDGHCTGYSTENVCDYGKCNASYSCETAISPDGTPCDEDQDYCTIDECQTGICTTAETIDCDDGDDCTNDTCDFDGSCIIEELSDFCKDDDWCTADNCISDGDGTPECENPPHPAGTNCWDSNMCTHPDQCDADGNCIGTPVDCNDNDPCTEDSCNSLTGDCINTPIDDCDIPEFPYVGLAAVTILIIAGVAWFFIKK